MSNNTEKYELLYIQKELSTRKNKQPGVQRVVQKAISKINKLCKSNDEVIIFLSPGYLGTNKKTREELTEKIFLDNNKKPLVKEVNILNVMNSKQKQPYQTELSSNHKIISRSINLSGNKDHRKMFFICKINNKNKYKNVFTKNTVKNRKHFINSLCSSIEVCGILIGSSNFSKTSYLINVIHGKSSNKDESDLFIYSKNYINNNDLLSGNLNSYYENDGIVVSNVVNKLPKNFLNNIFEKTLDGVLK